MGPNKYSVPTRCRTERRKIKNENKDESKPALLRRVCLVKYAAETRDAE